MEIKVYHNLGAASDLRDPPKWYSNDFPKSQDVKFDLGQKRPRATSSGLTLASTSASKTFSPKPRRKKSQPHKIWAHMDVWNMLK